MNDLPEYVDCLPNLCGFGTTTRHCDSISSRRTQFICQRESRIDFGRIRSAFAIALHMHQPLIPAGGGDLATAEIISNLKHMMDNPGIGDNHNAPVFHWCYKRMGEFIPQLVDEGKQPRVMLEYSGTLLHGLRHMGLHDVFDNLKRITCDHRYRRSRGVARLPVGPRGRAFDAGAGFPAARQSLATSLCRHLRLGGAATGARLFAVGDGAAQSSGHRL